MYLKIWKKLKLTYWHAAQPYPKKNDKNLTKTTWGNKQN